MFLSREANLILLLMGRVEEPFHDLQQLDFIVKYPAAIDVLQVKVEKPFCHA